MCWEFSHNVMIQLFFLLFEYAKKCWAARAAHVAFGPWMLLKRFPSSRTADSRGIGRAQMFDPLFFCRNIPEQMFVGISFRDMDVSMPFDPIGFHLLCHFRGI